MLNVFGTASCYTRACICGTLRDRMLWLYRGVMVQQTKVFLQIHTMPMSVLVCSSRMFQQNTACVALYEFRCVTYLHSFGSLRPVKTIGEVARRLSLGGS